ncbi:MAG: DUF4199 domain-containing protein [Bacteroides sp.]|nr:DUF4199 domain-containing protein [Bacteroides sp.]
MESRIFLHRTAMLFGTYMGGFWILKFILFPLGMTTPFLSLLFIILTLCVPFMGYYYVKMYRERLCGGAISFGHSWSFTLFMYMFAALLTAVAHYIYFRFIDQGFICNTIEEQLNLLVQSEIPGIETYVANYREAVGLLRGMTPIEITMQLLTTNVFCGMLLAIPTALFVMKKRVA